MQTDFQKRFIQLPDEFKLEVIDFIEFLYSKKVNNKELSFGFRHSQNESGPDTYINKNISAKQLLTLPLAKRKSILEKQARKAKAFYEDESDILLPDLTEDIIEA